MVKYVLRSEFTSVNAEGIQKIPKNWKLKQVRYLLKDGAEGIKIGPFGSALKLEDMVDEGYSVYGQENVIKKDFTLGKRKVSQAKFQEMSVYRIFAKDILITMMGTSGKCEIVPRDVNDGIIDSHLLRVRVKEAEILPEFFKLLIDESPEIAYQIQVFGKGSIMHGLNSGIVKSLNLPLPSTQEQKLILSFLEHETMQINTLIAKQRKLIELLKEKRQAVISQAVTKGLNPNAPMKDSGVEWLGEVPEHWIVTRAKFVSNIFVPQRNKPELNDSDGIAWVTMDDMKNKYIQNATRFVTDTSAIEASSKILTKGAVIASCVGNFGVTSINKIDVIINQQLQAFIPKRINAEFLQNLVSISKSYFELIGTAATLVYVNQEGFQNLPVLIPPYNEQEAICVQVENYEKKYDELIILCQQQIKILIERRTALISAAVTGKIDVRNWQHSNKNNNQDNMELSA